MLRIFLIAIVAVTTAHGQEAEKDTIKVDIQDQTQKFKFRQLVIPAALIGYGVVGIGNDQLLSFNSQIRSEVTEDIDDKLTIDDFSQYLPAASVYGLNALGIKGKHNFKDRTIIMATSYLLMSASVLSLKSVIREKRPDGTDYHSFPSGHTATAFAGAEFLWQEYKDVSIWYGISGYAIATGTGLFRIYNNKHWLTDVAAGAGIGILSTKIAYWINPWIQEKIFKSAAKNTASSIAPFYNGRQLGIGFVRSF